MQFLWKRSLSKVLTFLFLCVLSLPFGEVVFAAQSTVQWTTNYYAVTGTTLGEIRSLLS